jgi:dTDP-4-dehydrorhamnose reductase
MQVLITGASGLLGTWLLRQVPAAVDLVVVRHTAKVDRRHQCVDVDLRDLAATQAAVESVSPDVVLHAAYRRDRASVVDATRNVARVARQVHARLVSMSTDAVFSGDGHPRSEQDAPDPVWDYGRWKVEAEQAALTLGCDAAVVRLPLLVSIDPPDPTVSKVLEAVRHNESIGWHDGERRQPAWAEEVAAALWRLVLLDNDAAKSVWHLPGPERVLRRDIGARTAAELGVEDPGVTVPAPPPSQRPHDLYLTGQRAHRELSWNPSPVLVTGSRLRVPSGQDVARS